MIRIVNLKNYKLNANEVLIKVDRSSILGNPFHMHSESERDYVCNQYDDYFYNRIEYETGMLDVFGADTRFLEFVTDIGKQAEDHDIALGCWCYPKRCHASTIKNYVEVFYSLVY